MAVLSGIAQHIDRKVLSTLVKGDRSISSPGLETIERLTEIHFPSAVSDTTPPPYSSDRAELSANILTKYDYISPELVV